jgi:hypothetical protein
VGLATRYYFLSECCCLKFAVLYLFGALSDERMGLQFAVQSLNGPSSAEPVCCSLRKHVTEHSINFHNMSIELINILREDRNKRYARNLTLITGNHP